MAKDSRPRGPEERRAGDEAGSPAGALASARFAVTALLLAGALLSGLSCSEVHEPQDWRDGVRGGLGTVADTVIADTLIVEDAGFTPYIATGSSSFFLTGRLERGDSEIEGHAYLQWDLSDLPGGAIREAYVQLILRDVDSADTTATAPYRLWMYEVDEEWSEGGLDTLPARGSFVAGSGDISTGGVSDSSDVLLNRLFEEPALADLVADWRADSASNHGVVLIPNDDSPEGFLRLVSGEGSPQGTVSDVATPSLVITIDLGQKDTTVTKEAVDDAYVIDVAGGGIDLADSLLLVSSGFVHRTALRIDLTPLIEALPEQLPVGVAVHRATLLLDQVRDQGWSLPAEEQMVLQVREIDEIWSEAAPPESTYGSWISETTVTGSDSTIALNVRAPVQALLEGEGPSLVLRAQTEIGVFRSLLVKGRSAAAGRPQLEILYTRPGGGRLGPWPE